MEVRKSESQSNKHKDKYPLCIKIKLNKSKLYNNPKKVFKLATIAITLISININLVFHKWKRPSGYLMTLAMRTFNSISAINIKLILGWAIIKFTKKAQWVLILLKSRKQNLDRCILMLKVSMTNFLTKTCNFLLDLLKNSFRLKRNKKNQV